jgi:uncharacterized small protein (DUF1192 family)
MAEKQQIQELAARLGEGGGDILQVMELRARIAALKREISQGGGAGSGGTA